MKRGMAVFVSIMLWILSMKFSVAGFGADIATNPNDQWIGWTLAFSVTAFEIIWNGMKERTNLTMYIVGALCYAYGISTNIMGIMQWRGMSLEGIAGTISTGQPFQIISVVLGIIFVVALALVIEIAPEPAFVWGVTGNYMGGDFLGNLFGQKIPTAPSHQSWGGEQQRNNTPRQSAQTPPQNKPQQTPQKPSEQSQSHGNRNMMPGMMGMSAKGSDDRSERIKHDIQERGRDWSETPEPTYR